MAKVERAGVIVDYSGLERLVKRLENLEKKQIKWGFFNRRYSSDNDNLFVAQVALWQEQGTQKAGGGQHIPPRPFFNTNVLRVTQQSDPDGAKTYRLLDDAVRTVFESRMDTKKLDAVGEHLQQSLRNEIDTWLHPKNADYTIFLKGRDDPLVDSGTMRDSVESKVTHERMRNTNA